MAADENVAVGIKNSKNSFGALGWVLKNLVQEGDRITLIHVQFPLQYVPTPVGNIGVEQLSEQKVNAHRKVLQDEVDAFVGVFKAQCTSRKVQPNYVQVEGESIQKTLLDQVTALRITVLVLGGSSNTGLRRRFSASTISPYVLKNAPPSCSVIVVSKNKIISKKDCEQTESLSSSPSLPSQSSSQDSGVFKTVAKIHFPPAGLGKRWSFRRYLSMGSCESRNTRPIPLEDLRNARSFSSPFCRSEEIETLESADLGTTGLVKPRDGSGDSGSASSSSTDVRSIESSTFSLDLAGSIRKSTSTAKFVEATAAGATDAIVTVCDDELPRLDVSQESASTGGSKDMEALQTPTRMSRRKSLEELTQLAQKAFREYEYSELDAATKHFAHELKLGEGGYGVVYKGKLQGKEVAIKVLKKENLQKNQEFQREVELLGRIQHPHMVALLGCCSEKGCLVYEYLANGSLEDRLFCKAGTAPLPWYTRFRIAAEVAGALHFLHNLGSEPIVHRDLKPANVLLDDNYVSKVADVGLARLVPERLAALNSTYFRDTTPVGTFAYIDPEYQRTGTFGPKSDVYALGIVVLQLLTGKGPVGVHGIVEEAIECGTFSSILDEKGGEWPIEKTEEIACLALQCAEMKRRQRPDLKTVLPLLDNARTCAENFAAITATRQALSSESRLSVPPIYLCPLSEKVMEQPVVAADGYTYEYEAIRQWIQTHDVSPQTNARLEHKQLTPNHALHRLISEWKSRR